MNELVRIGLIVLATVVGTFVSTIWLLRGGLRDRLRFERAEIRKMRKQLDADRERVLAHARQFYQKRIETLQKANGDLMQEIIALRRQLEMHVHQ